MKTYKGCIFDLDGTLIDTLQDLADSVNEALERYGYPIWPKDSYRLKIGKGFRNLMYNALPEGEREKEEAIDKLLAAFDEIYKRRFMIKSCPYPGIPELLVALVEKGIFVAVNSNKRTDYTEKLIAALFPDTPWVDVCGEREAFGIPKKPHPAGALAIAEKMGLAPDEVLYIGDSATDIQTGKNAGMDTIGCIWGFRGREELEKAGATYTAETAEDIRRLIWRNQRF